jgi:hypothetical protein
VTQPFAAALLLNAADSGKPGFGRLFADYWSERLVETPMVVPALETLRLDSPAARGLPLLSALAAGRSAQITLGHGMLGSLRVQLAFD